MGFLDIVPEPIFFEIGEAGSVRILILAKLVPRVTEVEQVAVSHPAASDRSAAAAEQQ